MLRIQLQPAFVLHQRPYRNTSLLLDVFTRDYGRVGVVAKGVRQRASADRALLQPFNNVLISYCGRGDLMTLTAVERQAQLGELKAKALFSGLYMNELLLRLLHRNDPHDALFDYYRRSLLELAAHPEGIEPVLRRFECNMLVELGYGLTLDREAATGKPLSPGEIYYYDIERGPLDAEHAPATAQPRVSGRCLMALAAENFDDLQTAKEMKFLIRHVLAHYLGDRPLKSRELFI
jgi:DNA repair protein RecO (recombination protein O)